MINTSGNVPDAPKPAFARPPVESSPVAQIADQVTLTAGADDPQVYTPRGFGREFPDRKGYDENFLGIPLPMPQLDESIKHSAAPLLSDPSQIELKYTHFSVIQNKDRATPFVTAVNIDGAEYNEVDRKGDFSLDARLSPDDQMGKSVYKGSGFDRGHQVRRKDPMWGPDAEQASRDTFVYTNSTLQHPDLNQKTWLDLENNVLYGAVANKEKKTVFTGPIFRDDDPVLRNAGTVTPTRIPQAYWKVQVWKEEDQGLKAQAFVMSQKELIGARPAPGAWAPYEHMTPMKMQTYRVSMSQLEEMTNIHFGNLAEGADRTERDAQAITAAGIIVEDPQAQRYGKPRAPAGPE